MTAKELRAKRKALGMTQQDFAYALGVSRVLVGLMERGKRPITERTARVAETLRNAPLARDAKLEDPLERQIEEALIAAGVPFLAEADAGNGYRLDFYLPDHGIAIEIKRFYTPRSDAQLQRLENVILVQGAAAVAALATLIRSGTFPPGGVSDAPSRGTGAPAPLPS